MTAGASAVHAVIDARAPHKIRNRPASGQLRVEPFTSVPSGSDPLSSCRRFPRLPRISMPQLTTLRADELRAYAQRVRDQYQAFAARGLKLNLTRGKPSSAQLDLCNELLDLPGRHDFMAGSIDCRNSGELQGLPELRALLAPVYDLTPDRVVIGGNTSLGLMHDAVVYALLKGTCDSARPWSKEPRIAFICAVPGYDRHFSICNEFGIEMITVQLRDDGPDMDAVEQLVAADPQIKGMWCVPKYSNPSGAVYSEANIERLARMQTAAPDFRLFWDNAYAVHRSEEHTSELQSLAYL